ncbi:Cell cycle checkpoint protein RAD1 [Taenia crassiceps]|uniref:Cell cycle checkpoint protein RAD1 n=1 Tax=Taenia crassiceps TaxID=6207 RepID=A0ABR4QKT2_9CEST
MFLSASGGDPLVYAKTDNLRACINLLKAVHFRDVCDSSAILGLSLCLCLEDSGVVAECNIKTMDALEVLDFDFTSSQLISKVIIKSECVREAFSELDVTSDVLEISIIPPTLPQPRLRLTTYGFEGTTHYDFPRDSDPVEVFECSTAEPCVARYRLSLLRPSTSRALALSSRISLRMNGRGFLSLQYMIQAGSTDSTSFVEFFCVPDIDMPDTCTFAIADTTAT